MCIIRKKRNRFFGLIAVFQRVATKLEGWRKNGFVDTADQALLYRELDDFIALKYKELFDL